MKIACVYHSIDLDGWMSAAIVKLWWQAEWDNKEEHVKHSYITFIGYNHGQAIPDLSEYGKVIMCDIAFPVDYMKSLIDRLGVNFIWLDHHISAMNNCPATLPYADHLGNLIKVSGIRDTKFAACELTWKYFFPQTYMPTIVRLLGRYDCFGSRGTDEELKVLEFQYGARQRITNFEEAFKYLNQKNYLVELDIIERIHSEGKAIYAYLCTEAKQAYKNGFKVELGFRFKNDDRSHEMKDRIPINFIFINKERFNPINFGIDYHKDGYDGAACFHYDGQMWKFSLYNDNGLVDCSAIAKQYEGGGHKGAAGFALNNEEYLKFIIQILKI